MILCNSEHRTRELTEMAYEWCSVVCKNYSSLRYGKNLLLLSLQISFHHLNPQSHWVDAKLTHTEHHQEMAAIIFDGGDQETIADLLYAWTSESASHRPHPSLNICAKYLIGLHQPSLSPRLRKSIIYTIGLIGYQTFEEEVEAGGFIGFLDNLQVHVKDIDNQGQWAILLLDIIQSSKEIQHLSLPHWELLAELAVSCDVFLRGEKRTYSPYTTVSLEEAEEWQKLEC